MPPPARNLLRIAGIKRRARALGINKIDAAATGGLLVFGERSRADPVALAEMVQDPRRGCRLQGSHRLQFRADLSRLDSRFSAVENLLDTLATGSESAMTA